MFESVASSLLVRAIVRACTWLWSTLTSLSARNRQIAQTQDKANDSSAELRAALRLLLTSHDRTRAQNSGLWDLAIEISDLHAVGVVKADLRWLLSNKYVDHAIGWTRPGVDGRGFMLVGKSHLTEESCFVLTDEGVTFARDILGLNVHGAVTQPTSNT